MVGSVGMGSRAAVVIVAIVVSVWVATTLVLPVAVKGYSAPPEVSTIMGVVAGAAAAALFARRVNDRDDDPPTKGRKKE